MSRILIVGTNSFDSGKTHIAMQLGKILKDSGQSIEYFKPISGHNYWYNYEHTKYCLEIGELVSKDATIMKKNLGLTTPGVLTNPIHSLFVPARIERPLQNINGMLGIGGSSAVLVMQRFSFPKDNKSDSTVLIADSLIENGNVIIGYDEVGKLTEGVSVLSVENLQDFQEFEDLHYEKYVSESFAHIEKQADTVIIESFNDSTWPWDHLQSADYVLAVSPGHVFGYDPERFRKASYLSKRNTLPIREVTFGRISDLLKPSSRVEISPGKGLDASHLKTLGISQYTAKK